MTTQTRTHIIDSFETTPTLVVMAWAGLIIAVMTAWQAHLAPEKATVTILGSLAIGTVTTLQALVARRVKRLSGSIWTVCVAPLVFAAYMALGAPMHLEIGAACVAVILVRSLYNVCRSL